MPERLAELLQRQRPRRPVRAVRVRKLSSSGFETYAVLYTEIAISGRFMGEILLFRSKLYTCWMHKARAKGFSHGPILSHERLVRRRLGCRYQARAVSADDLRQAYRDVPAG